MPVTKFPWQSGYFAKGGHFQFRVLVKETKSKNWGVYCTKITRMFKVAKSSNIGTKKGDLKDCCIKLHQLSTRLCVCFFSGIRPNQLFRPYLDDIYEFPLKLLH